MFLVSKVVSFLLGDVLYDGIFLWGVELFQTLSSVCFAGKSFV